MKKFTLIFIALTFSIKLFADSFTWTGNSSNNWNDEDNFINDGLGMPNGVPNTGDFVTFNNSNNANCTLDIDVELAGIDIDGYTGTIDINGHSFQITAGDATFNTGTITGGTLTINTTGTVRFAGTTFGAIVNSVSERVFLNGSTFNSVVTIEKNGASNDDSDGGNTFAANTTITNSGTDRLLLGNGNSDDFQADLTFINSGSSYSRLANNSAGNTVDGNLIITNSGNGDTYIQINYNSASTLNITGNATLNNTGTGTQSRVYFDRDGTVSINGDLSINNNSGATTARMYIANRTTSQLTVSGTTTVNNDGTTEKSQVFLGNNGDIIFNGTLYITNSSSATNSQIYCNYNENSNNTYNENIVVECTDANCDGVRFGESNGTSTLATTKTITIGSSGFIAGDLRFRNFTQTGNTAHNLTATGTARIYNYDSNWGGDIRFIAPRNLTRGTTYNRTAYLEKTGAGNDAGVGGNTFIMDVDFINSGSGYFMLGNGTFDDYQANVSLLNSGTSTMYFARNGAGHTIAGDFIATNSASGTNTYIYVGDNNSVTLNIAGTTTLLNNSSSDNGRIYFGNRGDITCNNNVTATNNATGSVSNLYIGNVANITINGNLDINNTSDTIGNVYVANNQASTVQISGVTTVANSGAGTRSKIFLGNNGDIIFNGNLNITNNSSATESQIYCNYDDNSNNTYNENIVVECTDANCDGILFGNQKGTGTLADTKTITIGSGGFIAGYLFFRNFTQIGTTAQDLQPTGTTIFFNYNSEWNGNVNFVSPRHYTRGTTYNGTAHLEKSGNVKDISTGGNIFNAEATLVNSGKGDFMPANGTANDFNADVNYVKTNNGSLYPTYNCASTYAGDININANAKVYFGYKANGRVIFDGTTTQSINNTGTEQTFIFRDVQTNNSNSEITLNTPIEIAKELDLDIGNIITSSTNLLYMRDNSTVSSVSNDAYIDGPIEKIGNDAFTFPVGNDGYYAAISMSAPSGTTRRFRAQYFHQDADNAGDRTALEATINHISYEEYWTLDRTNGNSNVEVTLSWDNARSGRVDNLTTLSVAHWDGSLWTDEGNGSTTGDVNSGTVITSAAVTSFSPFTLASTNAENPLPIALLSFKGKKLDKSTLLNWKTQTEINNDYFILEKSNDGINYNEISKIKGSGNSNSLLSYNFEDKNPYNGINYYRLTQVDFDGKFEIFKPISIYFDNIINTKNINLYPNPIINSKDLIITYGNINEQSELKIIDVKGSIINVNYTIKEGKIEVYTRNLENGVYFVLIKANEEQIKKMFIVK